MKAVDFEYDGQFLSDYGFIICDFDGSTDVNVVEIGFKITFNKVPTFHGKRHVLVNTVYDDCISATFDICKNPEVYDDLEITNDDFRDLTRWLNRRTFLKLCIFDADEDYDSVYFNAGFNIEKIKIGEKICGLRLSMETDSPFAYGKEIVHKATLTSSSDSYLLSDTSDDIGFIYPTVTINCKSSGTLTLSNSATSVNTVIKNCSNGETITINGDTLNVTTNKSNHKIYDDFNYEFFMIGNTINERRNRISASIPCELEIRYNPIIKDLP